MQKTKIPSLVPVLILTLVTVVMWVGFDVYRALNKPTSPSVPAEISAPLTPSLDSTAIQQIESRAFLDDSQVPDNVITASPKPGVSATAAPKIIPTSSPIPSAPGASTSGTTP